jgi:hypothetical protein
MSNYQIERKQRIIDRLHIENEKLRRDNKLLKSAIDLSIAYLNAHEPKTLAAWSALRTAQQRYPGSMPWNCEVTRKDCEIFEAAE